MGVLEKEKVLKMRDLLVKKCGLQDNVFFDII